jgi:glutathione S-transferase
MTDLVLYTNPMSRGRIARWMLEEVGAPYRTEIVQYGPQMRSSDYLALNPMGKVPTLTHGAAVVTECAAICAYLADAFPQANLAPTTDDPARGAYFRWMFFAAGPVEAAVTNKSMGWEPPEDRRGMVGYGSFQQTLDTVEKAIGGGPFLLGDRFSAVDVYFGSQIIWGVQFGTMDKRPAFEAYAARLTARPAYQSAKALDDAAQAAAA